MQLITIHETNNQFKVNARELHEYLKSKRHFITWIKERIERYDLSQNIDYLVTNKKVYDDTSFSGFRNILEYFITINIAKEICMLENNERGKFVRKYFIEVEKRARELQKPLSIEQMTLKVIESLKKKIEEDSEKVDCYNEIVSKNDLKTIGEIAKLFKIGRNNLFKKLRELNILNKDNQPYQRYIDMDIFEVKVIPINGIDKNYIQTLVTAKGIDYIRRKIK